jgi:histidyl-tRNA synthetase
MSRFQSPRGTRDLLPSDQVVWRKVRAICEEVATLLAYQPISTPMFEEVGLFQRSLGQGTDIIDKELFLVEGRTEESSQYALRPEGTAGIVRAYIEHGMQTWPQPVRLYSIINNFRYERPQKGRYREHMQFDIEYFGDKGPFADAWVILTQWQVLTRLGLRNIHLDLNSLGTKEERAAYMEALVAHLTPLSEKLSEDSKRRLTSNPLRILDSKDANDQALLGEAPQLADFLDEESAHHIATVKSYLTSWQIPFQDNPRLVRGLDYYCHTCFEWVQVREGKSSLALGGGGRYDGLMTQLEGPDCGAVGAGLGLDRIVDLLQEQVEAPMPDPAGAYIVLADPELREAAQKIISDCLAANLRVEADFSKPSFGSQMKAAGRGGAKYAVILGKTEFEHNKVVVKSLQGGDQQEVELANLISVLKA